MAFTVRLAQGSGWISFENPSALLCASTLDEAFAALDGADEALAQGAHVAGYVSYELGAGMAGLPIRAPGKPLVLLGVFADPVAWEPPSEPFVISPLLRTVDAATYEQTIEEIHRAIFDGDVYQVNYTVPFDFSISGSIESAFAHVAASTQAKYQAIVQHDDAAILSWSPELFLQFDGTTLTTRPMKGTAAPGHESELRAEKNRGEHIMIVDLLRNDLQRVCSGVQVNDVCAIEHYPTYATMTTTISGTLSPDVTLRQIFAATFPCGSVTGAPKRSAIAHIARFETKQRDAYCGAIGHLTPQRRGCWNVAIRTAQLNGGVGRFDVGGGIVVDSDASEEWNEIVTKSAFLRRCASEVALIETFAGDATPATVALHLQRMQGAAARLDYVFDEPSLRAGIAAEARAGTIVRVRLKPDGTFQIVTEAFETPSDPVSVCLSGVTVRSNDAWLTIKSTWRAPYDRAMEVAQRHGCFDAILTNERGEVTEGSRTNLFLERDGLLLTPPSESGLLPGILRKQLLESGRAREQRLDGDDLTSADAIYIGNSARGLLRARLVQ